MGTHHSGKTRYVSALLTAPTDGRSFTDVFAAVRKNLSMSSRNQPYLRLTLGDKSGTIDAFVWDDAAEYASRFEEGDLISVTYRLRARNDVQQMHVESLARLSEKDLAEVSWEDFRPSLDAAVRERIWEETVELLGSFGNPHLAQFARVFLDDPEFRSRYLAAAAAKGFHHAYVGGLAEHTLGVMHLAVQVAALYPQRLDRDVLLAGAFLHDLGKLQELSPRTGDYTDEGRLLGHIVLGVNRLREILRQLPSFPAPLAMQLEHMLLSHHGQKEWGSPVEPQTLEAIVLNFLDNLDAKLAGAAEWLEKEAVAEGRWSSFWRGLGRSLYRPQMTLEDRGESGAGGDFSDIEAAFLKSEKSDNPAPVDAGPDTKDTPQKAKSQPDFGF